MQIRLLGGVDAVSDSGSPIDIGPAKCQAVLAGLALSAGAAVPVTRLVELVWGIDPPRTAEKTLQTYITKLRKSLGPEVIERTGSAYRLVVEPEAVDVIRFQHRIGSGAISAALDEWTGPPLGGLGAPGLGGIVDGLVEQWLTALELDLEQRVDQDPGATVGDLTELTAQYPLREGLWALLMTALYRSDRQADALRAYGRARTHLVEELGVEPGPRLRKLEELILGHDSRLAPEPTVSPSAQPSGTVTFAFSDVEGSARLWAEHRQLMTAAGRRHEELVRVLAAQHRGHVFAAGRDSIGVAFHGAGDAIRWGVEVQAAILAEGWPDDIDLRVRVGLHTGEAEERTNGYFGAAVNTAERIAAAGNGGQTLLSHATASVVEGVEFRDLGRFRFDGVRSAVQVFQVGAADHLPLHTEGVAQGNLPHRVEHLFGRDGEVDALAAAIDSSPIVTLVGPGGIGKTSLALAVARSLAIDLVDGAWLVELANVASSAEVARAIADVLDVKENAGSTVLESIVSHFEDRHSLVLLDNCEHVVDGAAEVAQALARECTDVTVLATSREGLGVAGEQLVVVGPLHAAGAAVQLFAERARSVDSTFDLDADRESVIELCQRLDGVPLAIELAAARVRSLTPADLVARLDDRLRLLTGGRRRSVERHRSLRATIEWSYDLLAPAEQTLFRRLSIFSGSFDLAAAEAVLADDELAVAEVNGLLGDLVDRSMVTVTSGRFGRRFRLLETIRQFAEEHLAEAGDSDRLAARHAEYVCHEVQVIGELLFSNDEVDGAARLAELWPNVRAAMHWALAIENHELAAGIVAPVALQMFSRRGLGEIADWVERLLAITPPSDRETAAMCVLWASTHYSMTQRREEFRTLIETSGVADHLFAKYAYLLGVEDEDFGAITVGPQVVVEMRQRGEENYARLFELFTAAAVMTSGDFAGARATHERLAELFRAEGPPSFLNWTLYLLGASAVFQGDVKSADRYWDECASIELPARTNSPNETLAARTAFREGRHRQAFRLLGSHVDDLIDDDNMAGVAIVAIEFINMMTAIGRLEAAALTLGHLEATGLLGVEGPGFKLLVADSAARVEADETARVVWSDAAAEGLDERTALAHMRDVLSGLH